MARRTLEEIQEALLLKKSETESLSALEVLTNSEKNTLENVTSTSKVSIWRLWIFIQSFAIWIHEGIFEIHQKEIEDLIALNKIHTARWYREQALLFQFGFEYPETEITGYNNEGVDSGEILDSLIVKQSAVEEVAGRLKIKVATEDSGGVLTPLSDGQLAAFTQYIRLVKDAGTVIEIISRQPDDVRVNLDIYFDPLVLDLNGARLDGNNNEPVVEAIESFLRSLEFNGEFLTDNFESFVKAVQGVELVGLNSIEARFGANSYETVDEVYIADAGYMKLNLDETTINYIPREVR